MKEKYLSPEIDIWPLNRVSLLCTSGSTAASGDDATVDGEWVIE